MQRMKMTSKNKRRALLPAAPGPAPWLVFPCGDNRKKQTFFSVSNPKMKNNVMSIPEFSEKECLASMHGWLVTKDIKSVRQNNGKKSQGMVGWHQCILLNPDTAETIDLPPWKSHEADNPIMCVLSCPPTNPNCMILFVARKYILFLQLGDEKWIKQDYILVEDGDPLDDFIDKAMSLPDGTIYGLTAKNRVVIIETSTLSVRLVDFQKPELYFETLCNCKYMVECSGEIYLVIINYEGIENKAIKHIEIFRMDFFKDIWVKVRDLGEYIFFLSDFGCLSCSAKESGLEENLIYFTLSEDKSLYVFSLEEETLSLYLPCPNLRKPFFSPLWLIPNKRLVELKKDVIKIDKTKNKNIVLKENEVEMKESHWIDLPMDVLWLIAKKLSLGADYRNFRPACKAWASLIPTGIRWTFDMSGLTTTCPWLMYSKGDSGTCNFFDPEFNVTHYFDMPELLGARICFSRDGWLLMSKGSRSMFFFNPFTNVTFKLPDLPRDFAFSCLSFAYIPTSSYCIVFCASTLRSGLVDVCYLCVGEDAWTWKQFENGAQITLSNNSPVFYNGAFYCSSHGRYLGVFAIRCGRCVFTILSTPRPYKAIEQSYLVGCNGGILLIYFGCKGKWVDVYKLDLLHMTWRFVNSLEDKMVFVSHSTTVSFKAMTKRMQNKIFFPISFSNMNNYVCYSLDTGRWHSSFDDYARHDIYNTKEVLHCTWIQPPLSLKKDFPR